MRMTLTNARRRARWKKTCADATARGVQVESDPRFLGWIEEWINGAIEMAVVRERYLGLLRDRAGSNALPIATPFLDEISNEVPDFAGLTSRAQQERENAADAIDAAWTDESARGRD